MSAYKEFKTMGCVLCGRLLPYPECFPNSTMAECWRCCWDSHIRSQHPKSVKAIRKEARRRARRLTEIDVERSMTLRERQIVLGPVTETTTTPTQGDDPA